MLSTSISDRRSSVDKKVRTPERSVVLTSVCSNRSWVARACQARTSTAFTDRPYASTPRSVPLPPPAKQSLQVPYLSSQSPHLFNYHILSSSLFFVYPVPRVV